MGKKVPYLVKIHRRINGPFRRARWALFAKDLDPKPTDKILDVGGTPASWIKSELTGLKVTLLNQWQFPDLPNNNKREIIFTSEKGDGCNLPYNKNEFDISYSNSVIEHVGTWENQKAFAESIRKAGRKLWVQTPAKEFVIEPHYLSPFTHWLPARIQKRMNRWITLWGWLHRPSPQKVSDMVDELRLLSFREMKILFPDCEIRREKFLGILTKSYIAVRLSDQ